MCYSSESFHVLPSSRVLGPSQPDKTPRGGSRRLPGLLADRPHRAACRWWPRVNRLHAKETVSRQLSIEAMASNLIAMVSNLLFCKEQLSTRPKTVWKSCSTPVGSIEATERLAMQVSIWPAGFSNEQIYSYSHCKN